MAINLSLTSIEWIATILIIVGLIKVLVILIDKKIWLNNVVKPIYSHKITTIIFAALAGICLFYLLQELSIVQILASVAFSALLIGSVFAAYGKDLIKFASEMFRRKFSFWIWIYTIVWLALMGWAAYVIFLA